MMADNNWWAKKLGNPGLNTSATPPTAPLSNLPYAPQQQQPNTRVAYDQNSDQLVSKAQSSRDMERCPGCMSGNYMAPVGTQRKRCYDCGYPIVQAGTGLGGTGQGGSPIAAKQPNQDGGFNPTTIIGRVE
jgi:ribosomal protein S27AE